jgi:hypothetical protein
MSDTDLPPITAQTLQTRLEQLGAKVMTRSGRSDHYGSPREFSFEVKAIFANGLGLHILARQYNYRDPWETGGRVNDMVDISLLKDGAYSELPRGYAYFQLRDTEEGVEWETFCAIAACVAAINPKIYRLQQITGDL